MGYKQTIERKGQHSELQRRIGSLSPRERDVFELVVKGFRNRVIGEKLGITEKTVKVHRGRVMTKMKAESIAMLARMDERLKYACGDDPVVGPQAEGGNSKLWECVFDSLPDAVMFVDCNHRVLRVNRQQAKMLGGSQEEYTGLYCYEVFHGRETPAPNCPHARMLMGGAEHSCKVDFQAFGSRFVVSARAVADESGTVLGSLHTTRPVSARRDAEELAYTDPNESPARVLTRKEILIMRMLADDHTSKSISNAHGLSLHTVRTHIKNILKKLRVHKQAEAVYKWRCS